MPGKAQFSAGLFVEFQSKIIYPAMKNVEGVVLRAIMDGYLNRDDLISEIREVFSDKFIVHFTYQLPKGMSVDEELFETKEWGTMFLVNVRKVQLLPCPGPPFEEKPELALNAAMLQGFLEHQDMIPPSWKGKRIFFWGTTFYNDEGYFVKSMSWNEEEGVWQERVEKYQEGDDKDYNSVPLGGDAFMAFFP